MKGEESMEQFSTPITSTPRTVSIPSSTWDGDSAEWSISVSFIQGEETMQVVWKFKSVEERDEAYAMWEDIIFNASEHNSAIDENREEEDD